MEMKCFLCLAARGRETGALSPSRLACPGPGSFLPGLLSSPTEGVEAGGGEGAAEGTEPRASVAPLRLRTRCPPCAAWGLLHNPGSAHEFWTLTPQELQTRCVTLQRSLPLSVLQFSRRSSEQQPYFSKPIRHTLHWNPSRGLVANADSWALVTESSPGVRPRNLHLGKPSRGPRGTWKCFRLWAGLSPRGCFCR